MLLLIQNQFLPHCLWQRSPTRAPQQQNWLKSSRTYLLRERWLATEGREPEDEMVLIAQSYYIIIIPIKVQDIWPTIAKYFINSIYMRLCVIYIVSSDVAIFELRLTLTPNAQIYWSTYAMNIVFVMALSRRICLCMFIVHRHRYRCI